MFYFILIILLNLVLFILASFMLCNTSLAVLNMVSIVLMLWLDKSTLKI